VWSIRSVARPEVNAFLKWLIGTCKQTPLIEAEHEKTRKI
jgi:hypothetical protein